MSVFKLHQLDTSRQHLSRFGERYAVRQSVKQRDADGLLQLTDTASEGRLTDIEGLSGGRDVALFDNTQEMTQQPRMHGNATFLAQK